MQATIATHVRRLADGITVIAVGAASLLSVHWHASTPALVDAQRLVPLALATALAAQWTERVCSILYEWPTRSGWRGRRPRRERPLLRVPLYALLYLGTSWSTIALAVVQSPSVPRAIRIACAGAVGLCALPFWLVATQPRTYWRRTRGGARVGNATPDVTRHAD